MKKILHTAFAIMFVISLNGQEQFTASVSNDSILIGNRFTLKITLENIQGEFEAPAFQGMNVVSGPNMASSFQSINGETSQSITYSYILEPVELGELIIDQAFLVGDDETLATDFIKVQVYPNPDGIIQDDGSQMMQEFSFGFPDPNFGKKKPMNKQPEKSKKKYKLKKI